MGVHSSGRNSVTRSLIPPHVHVLALTATLTVSSRNKIIKILGMMEPSVIALSPDKAMQHVMLGEREGECGGNNRSSCSQIAKRKKCKELSSSVDDVTTVPQYMTFHVHTEMRIYRANISSNHIEIPSCGHVL